MLKTIYVTTSVSCGNRTDMTIRIDHFFILLSLTIYQHYFSKSPTTLIHKPFFSSFSLSPQEDWTDLLSVLKTGQHRQLTVLKRLTHMYLFHMIAWNLCHETKIKWHTDHGLTLVNGKSMHVPKISLKKSNNNTLKKKRNTHTMTQK